MKATLGKLQPLFWVISFLYFALQLATPMVDHDLWWQLAVGKVLVETKTFLRTETFSSTLAGTPWINFEWLGQVILYLAVKWFGLISLYLGKIFFSLLALALTIASAAVAGLKGPWLLIFSWFMFFVLEVRLIERLELFSLIFSALFVLLILIAREHHTPELRRRWPVLAFLTMVLWVNLHAGFVVGIGIIFLATMGARYAKESRTFINLLDRMLVVSLLGVMVNPFGPKIILAIVENLTSVALAPVTIGEWRPLAMHEQVFFWILFGVTTITLVVKLLMGDKEARFWSFLVTAFAAWGGMAFRNTVYLVFVAFPFLASIYGKRFKKMVSVGYFAIFAIFSLQLPQEFKSRTFEEVNWKHLPMGACRFVKDKKIDGTLFNSYELGGYIEWFFGPAKKIFVDGRYIFFDNARRQMELFGKSSPESVQMAWREYFDEHEISYAIVGYPRYESAGIFKDFSPLNYMFPRAGWALVYWDDAALVFLRRDLPEYEPIIRRNEYRYLWPYNFTQMAVMLKQGDVLKGDMMTELTRQRQFVGNTTRGRQLEELLKSF